MVLISQLSHGALLAPFLIATISLGFFFLVLEPCLVYANAFGWSFHTTQKHWVGKTQILGLLFAALLFVIKEEESALLAAAGAMLSWQIYHKFYWEKYYPKTPLWQTLIAFIPLFLVGLAIAQFSLKEDATLTLQDYGWAFYFYAIFVTSRYFSLCRRTGFTLFSLLLIFLGGLLFSFISLSLLALLLVPFIWLFPTQRSQTAETALLFAYLAAPLFHILFFH